MLVVGDKVIYKGSKFTVMGFRNGDNEIRIDKDGSGYYQEHGDINNRRYDSHRIERHWVRESELDHD